MAMPPSERSSSGSLVPRIGTSVSRCEARGHRGVRGSAATQHGVPCHVPSQSGRRSTAPSSAGGGLPRAGGSPRPSRATSRLWSWTSSQWPSRVGGRAAALGGLERVAERVAVERKVDGEGSLHRVSQGSSATRRRSNSAMAAACSRVSAISSWPRRRPCLRNASTSKAMRGAVGRRHRLRGEVHRRPSRPARAWSCRRRAAPVSARQHHRRATPFLKQFSKKMSPKDGAMTARMP